MKKYFYIIIVLAVFVVGIWLAFTNRGQEVAEDVIKTALSPKDATYVIDGKAVTLSNGLSEIPAAPGSASKIITRYFGNEVAKDLNDDGREDVVFLLTRETGGTGVFYYVIAALNTESGYIGSQAFLIGDRIAPQTTEISQNPNHKNVIVVNYADRNPGEPMSAKPSVGKSVWLKLDPETMQFGEVAQSFEGESDPSRMTLGMKTWVWQKALYNDGREILPKNPGKFTIAFSDKGTFSASTDCNGIGGNYETENGKISFEGMISTLMYCNGSQESDFRKILENAQSYHFTSKGEFVIDLKFDSGSAIFR